MACLPGRTLSKPASTALGSQESAVCRMQSTLPLLGSRACARVLHQAVPEDSRIRRSLAL